MTAATSFLGRALLAAIFIVAGINKVQGYEATAGYMASVMIPGLNAALGSDAGADFMRTVGIPMLLLPATIALEILAGLAVLIGLYSRIAAILLAMFTVLTGLIFHSNFADDLQLILFLKNLAVAGGFLLLFAHGPGSFAINDK
jgi:putative oxidoreductase